VVILRIANCDGIASRQAKRIECGLETGGLADALGQDHHTTPVENQHERQFERPNHLEQPRSFGGIRVD
jgi:hypothetical protein